MANVMELVVARLLQDVVDVGRKIVFAHLMEGEVPELHVVAVEAGVILGVAIAARIPHPNVVAEIVQDIAEAGLGPHQHPSGRSVQDAVHQEHRLRPFLGNAVHLQNVAVLGDDGVRLRRIPILAYQFWLCKRTKGSFMA